MQITKDEALAIIGKTDPRHEAYYRNDADTVAAVNGAFEAAYPGEYELGGGIDSHTENLMGQALRPAPQSGQGDQVWNNPHPGAERSDGQPVEGAPDGGWSPQWNNTPEQTEAELRNQLGHLGYEQFQSAINDKSNLEAVFGPFLKNENDKRQIYELASAAGANPTILRLYRHLIKLATGK